VLDVGCFDSSLFRRLGSRLGEGVGIDPLVQQRTVGERFCIEPGEFPDAVSNESAFDVITMLAVLEHVPDGEIDRWTRSCLQLLRPGGRVVATVPSPAVDRILGVLFRLHLTDGMGEGVLEQHHGASPVALVEAFVDAGFRLEKRARFELGLNNLFVFGKPV
jgi:SAM-dependent methyltransferase